MNLACTHASRNHHATPTAIPAGPAVLPEAQCSVNGRFYLDVPGYPDAFQVTGRGQTPQEAAQNLKATMDATRAALAPVAPPSREARLSQLLACGTLRAVQRGDMALVERLVKGFTLAVKGLVEPTDVPHIVAVRSQSNPSTWYTVESSGPCSCPDWAKHQTEPHYRCKHGAAALFYRRVEEESLKA